MSLTYVIFSGHTSQGVPSNVRSHALGRENVPYYLSFAFSQPSVIRLTNFTHTHIMKTCQDFPGNLFLVPTVWISAE